MTGRLLNPINEFVRDARRGRMSRREILRYGSALGLSGSVLSTLLQAPTAEAQDAASGELTVAVLAEPACWNPIEGPCGGDIVFHDLVMERLVTFDPEGKLSPGLATSWEVIDDLTWEFKLREGVTFTNGEPFNADAVLFMFEPILNPEGRQPPPTAVGSYRLVDHIEVIDDYTVRFITTEPSPLLANYMAFEPRAVPPQYYTDLGWEEFGRQPIGTGPYILLEWVQDDHFVLEANPEYWGEAPAIQRLVFRPIPEDATRVSELLAGGVDIAAEIPGDLVGDLESSGEVNVITSPSVLVVYVNLRPEDRLQDLALREAFQYATNVDIIVEELLGGLAEPNKTGNAVTRFEFGYNPDIPDWPYDPDLARQKLEEAGYDGREIELYYSTGEVAQASLVAQALQAQWAEVGLNVSVNGMEAGIWTTHWRDRTVPGDIYMGDTSAKGMDSDARLVPSIHCYDPERGLGRVAWFCDPEIDALIEQSQVTLDVAERERLLSEAWVLHHESAHHLTLYSPFLIYGASNRVEWAPTPEGLYSTLARARLV